MNLWFKSGGLLLLGLMMVACEDAVIEYSSDLRGVYMVESATIDGVTTDYSVLPLEEAWIIDIGKDNLIFAANGINQCDTSYQVDARAIDSVTDTAIIFSDHTRMYYTILSAGLTLSIDDDVLTLAGYEDAFPPAVWTDPSLLTNDIYEPDDSLSLATRISAAGSMQTHYSAVCDDEDYFIFEALGGTSYIIEAEAAAGSDIDLTLFLYSAAGDSMAYNDDQSATNVDPKLEWTCPGSGDYYFIIKKYWDYLDPGNSLDDDKGEYTVSIDVTKNLIKAPGSGVVKVRRPVRSTQIRERFFAE